MFDHLPGSDILSEGLRDLETHRRTVPALLVLIGAPRLARCGINIPVTAPGSGVPEHELYDLLVAEHGPEAFRLYRSFLRRLVSLENALDSSVTAAQGVGIDRPGS